MNFNLLVRSYELMPPENKNEHIQVISPEKIDYCLHASKPMWIKLRTQIELDDYMINLKSEMINKNES